jgi:hypothetical protein
MVNLIIKEPQTEDDFNEKALEINSDQTTLAEKSSIGLKPDVSSLIQSN